jgi:hypothetical protein
VKIEALRKPDYEYLPGKVNGKVLHDPVDCLCSECVSARFRAFQEGK